MTNDDDDGQDGQKKRESKIESSKRDGHMSCVRVRYVWLLTKDWRGQRKSVRVEEKCLKNDGQERHHQPTNQPPEREREERAAHGIIQAKQTSKLLERKKKRKGMIPG